MSAKTITFFNNKGGVGKTSLVYHLAVMYVELGLRVVVADLDPQSNLTAAFSEEDRLSEIWQDDGIPNTIFKCVSPLIDGRGDIEAPSLEMFFEDRLAMINGDLSLSRFEDDLSSQWPECLDEKPRAFRVISAFWRIIQKAAFNHDADLVVIDIGPNLGAINRAALISSDHVVVPLAPDLFSLQGMKNLGPALKTWRKSWQERVQKNPLKDERIPDGAMMPVGYIVMQHSERDSRPVRAYQQWIERIPSVYRNEVLGEEIENNISLKEDPHCLALLKHYRSLMPMAQEAKKPMFFLKPADGAIGAHTGAVLNVYHDFKILAIKIAERISLMIPS